MSSASVPGGDRTYDALGSRLVTGEAVALDLLPTPYVLRAAGAAIDVIVYGGSYVLLLLGLAFFSVPFAIEEAVIAAVSVTLAVTTLVIVPTAVETLSHGRSLGRLAVGARIVRDDGGAIGLRHAFIRALVGVLELVMTLGGLAALVGLLDERSRRLGDMLAGTYSQRERVAKLPSAVFGVPIPLQAWAATADVARLPARVSRRLAQFLTQAPSLTPASRSRLAAELAAEAAPYVSPLPAADPELFVAAVAAIRRERELTGLRLQVDRLERLEPTLRALPRGFPSRDEGTRR
jgi:uncharacterized RDD family membrane protein YckC